MNALNVQEKYVRRLLWKVGSQLASDIFLTQRNRHHSKRFTTGTGGIYQSVTQAKYHIVQRCGKGAFAAD